METTEKGRRDFLKSLALGAAGAAMLTPQTVNAAEGGTLQVWSCGGLAEAMMPAHEAYQQHSGVKIVYTGAFAAALGKSLLTGGGQTEVFAGRVLALAQNLRKAGLRGEMNFSDGGFKSLMRQAGKSGARYCLIMGPDEAARNTVVIKNLESGEQTAVPQSEALHFLQTGTN